LINIIQVLVLVVRLQLLWIPKQWQGDFAIDENGYALASNQLLIATVSSQRLKHGTNFAPHVKFVHTLKNIKPVCLGGFELLRSSAL